MRQRTECELCGARSAAIVYQLTGFNVRQCSECGLVFRDTIMDDEETRKLYGATYFKVEQQAYFFSEQPLKQRLLKERIAKIEALYPQKGILLDVGCAVGTFLAVARDAGWTVKGVEVSEFASQTAREKHGLNVFTGTLEQATFTPASFDVVTMWDVVEHLEHPQSLLEAAKLLIKQGGLLVIGTNMEDSLLCKVAVAMYRLSAGLISRPVSRCHPIHHATFYATATLNKAVEQAGLEVEKVEDSDLDPGLINTNFAMRQILRIFSRVAAVLGMPLEKIIYARRKK